MNSTDIKETCKQIIDEATAIIAYTDSIDCIKNKTLKSVYAEDRKDELSHLQKLIVALTEILSGEEPKIAEEME